MRRYSSASIVLLGGLLAAAFDITYAIVFSALRGVSATRVLQSVASGLLGAAAYDGGTATAALGLLLHFLMVALMAGIFYLASRQVPLLVRRAVVSGILYGAVIYAVMNLVVLPLSAFPRKVTFTALSLGTGLLVHMFLVGLPIALAVRKARAAAQSGVVTGP